MSACLTIFAKAPELGKAKTRLAQTIGPEATLAVYQQLLAITAECAHAWNGPVLVCRAGDPAVFATCPLAEFEHVSQCDGNLGDRLHHGLGLGLERSQTAIAIGTDCPGLSIEALATIDGLTDSNDIAIGPSPDGGYWSLGVASAKALDCSCATDLPWSQPTLRAATTAAARSCDLAFAIGPTLFDVDEEEDLLEAQKLGYLRT